jgi:hypothetical protein
MGQCNFFGIPIPNITPAAVQIVRIVFVIGYGFKNVDILDC